MVSYYSILKYKVMYDSMLPYIISDTAEDVWSLRV